MCRLCLVPVRSLKRALESGVARFLYGAYAGGVRYPGAGRCEGGLRVWVVGRAHDLTNQVLKHVTHNRADHTVIR